MAESLLLEHYRGAPGSRVGPVIRSYGCVSSITSRL